MTDKELDRLLGLWSEESLPPAEDAVVTESILDFVDADDDMDIEKILCDHIHELAEEERGVVRRRWALALTGAAASLILLISFSVFMLRDKTLSTEKTTQTVVLKRPLSQQSADTKEPEQSGQIAITETKIPVKRNYHIPTAESTPVNNTDNVVYAEETDVENRTDDFHTEITNDIYSDGNVVFNTLAEINTGVSAMLDSVMMDLSGCDLGFVGRELQFMADSGLLYFSSRPTVWGEEIEETDMPGIGSIGSNLIEVMTELKNLNVNLNFETDK